MTRNNARETALADVRRWKAELAKWQAERMAAGAELHNLRARMGDEILEDPTRRDAVAAALQAAERNEEVAISAAAAAAPKLLAAQHLLLEGDAAALDQQAAALLATLGQRHARTAELREQLSKQEGETRDIERAVEQTKLKAAVLRAEIAGDNPNALFKPYRNDIDGTILGLEREEYFSPAIWGPDAAAPGRDFAARVAAKRQAIVDHDAQAYDPSGRIAELELKIADAEAKDAARVRRGQDADRTDVETLMAFLAEIIAKRDGHRAYRAALVAELEELTGQSETVEV